MRQRFDKQLQQLKMEMIQMGALCEDAIALACQSLDNGDGKRFQQVKSVEQEIDRKERSNEALCMNMLLHQQPVARDLREISSALKMVSDMERIGDQAADIAEIAQYIKQQDWQSFVHIREMAEVASGMLTQSIDSFVKGDLALANIVIQSDDQVDDLFQQVRLELIALIAEDQRNGEMCIDLLMVAKYFERIADHATNIAEWVVYAITGEKL